MAKPPSLSARPARRRARSGTVVDYTDSLHPPPMPNSRFDGWYLTSVENAGLVLKSDVNVAPGSYASMLTLAIIEDAF